MKNIFKRSPVLNANSRKRAKKEESFSVRKWDPLYIIFEKHLYDFNYDSRDLFIRGVIDEYAEHLTKNQVIIPTTWRPVLEKNLAEEIADMLVRKLYGCLTVKEFQDKEEQNTETLPQRKEARKRYQKLVG